MPAKRQITVNISSSGLSSKKEAALVSKINSSVSDIIKLSNCEKKDKKNKIKPIIKAGKAIAKAPPAKKAAPAKKATATRIPAAKAKTATTTKREAPKAKTATKSKTATPSDNKMTSAQRKKKLKSATVKGFRSYIIGIEKASNGTRYKSKVFEYDPQHASSEIEDTPLAHTFKTNPTDEEAIDYYRREIDNYDTDKLFDLGLDEEDVDEYEITVVRF